jgi:hypothetical protein
MGSFGSASSLGSMSSLGVGVEITILADSGIVEWTFDRKPIRIEYIRFCLQQLILSN